MSKTLSMSYDREAGAGYITLTGEPVETTVEVENNKIPFGITVDLDASGKPVGLELLGRINGTAELFLSSISDGSLREALIAAGYDIRKFAGSPEIAIHRIG